MTDSIPFYLEELVCSLAEHTTDDDFIVSVCLSLMGNERRVAEVLSYLERQTRTHDQIQDFLSRLTDSKSENVLQNVPEALFVL